MAHMKIAVSVQGLQSDQVLRVPINLSAKVDQRMSFLSGSVNGVHDSSGYRVPDLLQT